MPAAVLLNEHDLVQQVQARIGRRVRNLSVEFRNDRVILRGQTSTYHVKQLAQHSLSTLLPDGWRLENAILVLRNVG
jgi:hypothetical protein